MMNTREMDTSKKIAIIGAGWCGIGILRQLKNSYSNIDVFEQNDDVGGTWHPRNCYAGLSIHSPALHIEYPDFPLPTRLDRLERVTSNQVYNYFKSYCTHKSFYDHIQFDMTLKKIDYDSSLKKIHITLEKKGESEPVIKEYDYVIYTHGFTDRNIPAFKNRESYKGTIIHSYDANETRLKELMLNNKKISIIGGSKTATDLILYFYRHGYVVNWIYRQPYWFIKFDDLSKVSEKMLRKNKWSWKKNMLKLSLFSGAFLPRLEFFLMRSLNLLDTFGKKHSDFKKYHGGTLDLNQLRVLKKYNLKHGIQGEIDGLENDAVVLKDGRRIESDVIICATGSAADLNKISITIDNKQFDLNNVKSMYHGRVIPEIPGLVFTAYSNFTLGISNGLITGKWLEKYIGYELDYDYLKQNETVYNHGFFSNQYLFNSNQYLTQSGIENNYSFIKSKEVKLFDFLNLFVDSFFIGSRLSDSFSFRDLDSEYLKNKKRQTNK